MKWQIASWVGAGLLLLGGCSAGDVDTIEVTDYRPPAAPPVDDGLADDVLPVGVAEFNAGGTDSRPLGDWQVNASQAVTRLDVVPVRPDAEPSLGRLYPSYAAALAADRPGLGNRTILPSVNLIDGKAKQFDDGLYACLDLAHYRGVDGVLASQLAMIERLMERVGPDSPASPFLAAGLELAGQKVAVKADSERARWRDDFERNELRSKPIGFYTWSPELSEAFRVLRYFQASFREGDLAIPRALAKAFEADPALLGDYRKVLAFYARLSNPAAERSVADLIGHDEPQPPSLRFCLLPPSTSRETELFEKLFPNGLPPGASLIRELVAAVRSGAVDLRPRDDGGWYDHQVYALESLLLPERGEEHEKLLLTRSYKRRMLDAFQALMTKRRETHVRDAKTAVAGAAEPLTSVAPRLRLEPCPSYYLRTARSYTFLADFLEERIGSPALKALHGLREGGERPVDLATELESTRQLFYGFYLVSAEDIGLEPACLDKDGVDANACRLAALAWLARPAADPDLAIDTRVSVPLYSDPMRGATRIWATLGVRLAKLDADYARAPQVRPIDGSGAWVAPASYLLQASHYLIAVDEVAEVELKGLRVLNRAELRKLCDRNEGREAIVRAIAR